MARKSKLFILIILFLVFMMIIPTYSMGINTNDYNPKDKINDDDANFIMGKFGNIYNVIVTIGIAVSVITLIILGIKYMLGSIEEKAEYKKSMIPYIVGVIFIGGISSILALVSSIVENL